MGRCTFLLHIYCTFQIQTPNMNLSTARVPPCPSSLEALYSVSFSMGGSFSAVAQTFDQSKRLCVFSPAPFHVDLHSRHIFNRVHPASRFVTKLKIEARDSTEFKAVFLRGETHLCVSFLVV